MKPSVTIIDYGVGNILSITKAFEHCGANVVLTEDPQQIIKADRLVLPGVGAFKDGMEGLRERGLIESIKSFAEENRPLMGICLGMQMMLESSEEFGLHEGLFFVPGRVVAIPKTGVTGKPHKIPSIGWYKLDISSQQSGWGKTILEDVPVGAYVYFVHSYTALPVSDKHRLADYRYDGCIISAVIRLGLLYGCQFHPEKSGEVGLTIIRNFLKI